MYYKPDKSL